MELILSHSSLDFDAFAGMIAASKIYPEAKVVPTGAQNRNVREYIALHRELFDLIDVKSIMPAQIRRVIMIDTRQADRLGEFEDIVLRENIEVFVFDHHPRSSEDIVATEEFSANVGAVTTILVDIIKEKQIPITPVEATLFALGIHEDTGSLTYQTTTFADAEALAFLMSQGANIDVINRFLDQPLSKMQKELLGKLLAGVNTYDIKGMKIAITSGILDEYVEGASTLAHKIEALLNTEAIFLLVTSGDRTYLIARSRIKQLDVAKITSVFGGGGHPVAASAVIKNADIDDLTKKILKVTAESVAVSLTAEQIMSKPVRTVGPDVSIQEASRLMLQYGFTGLPVAQDDGKLVGVISKRDLGKAHDHGLIHAPVKGFMSHKLITAGAKTDLAEIQQLISDHGIGRLPIIEDGKLVGIITRHDVLRLLYGTLNIESVPVSVEPRSFLRQDIQERIKTLLPNELRTVLISIGELATTRHTSVYLVGGIVRDLLLNVPNFDIDIVVEGDGIAFADAMIAKFGGHIRAHQKFKTAVVVLPNHRTIDIASARIEYYPYPAALPHVQMTSVKKDLGRRDFTINAMAIALNTDNFGELLDFFGGQRDLLERKVRVLHNLSFIEDPTRIFRAVRFEQRYRFSIEEETEELIRKAMDMEMIGGLTNARIRDELVLILSEDNPWPSLSRLGDFGVLTHVHHKIAADAGTRNRFVRIGKVLNHVRTYFETGLEDWLVYMMALLEPLSPMELDDWCFRMRLRKAHCHTLHQGLYRTKQIQHEYIDEQGRITNSSLYLLLSPLEPEALCYLIAIIADRSFRAKIAFNLETLRKVQVAIDGTDLIAAGFKPSPAFKSILNKVLIAKLDGHVRSFDEELKYAVDELNRINAERVRT